MSAATREAWLLEATEELWPLTKLDRVPLRVACGWPARKALSRRSRRVGECWAGERQADKLAQLFVSPCLDAPAAVLATLLHEMLHAALPLGVGHKAPFARAATAAGLVGKPSATTAGPELAERLNAIAFVLGAYPHVKLDGVNGHKKQTTRLRLYECACPVKVRVASDSFDATCNDCGDAFERKD
jgi:hypothetical protein